MLSVDERRSVTRMQQRGLENFVIGRRRGFRIGAIWREDENANEVTQDEEQPVCALEKALHKCVPDSQHHRQVVHLLHLLEQQEKEKREQEDYWYDKKKEILISKGVSPETEELLVVGLCFEIFLVNKSALFLSSFNHVHGQILMGHRPRSLDFYE